MKKSKPEKWKITVDHGDSITEVYVVNPRNIFPQQIVDLVDNVKAEAEKREREKKNGNDR